MPGVTPTQQLTHEPIIMQLSVTEGEGNVCACDIGGLVLMCVRVCVFQEREIEEEHAHSAYVTGKVAIYRAIDFIVTL